MIAQHIISLIEWSALASIIGLPFDVWVIREMLDLPVVAIASRYGNMPLVPEWRYFARDGNIVCSHPYWPEAAIRSGGPQNGCEPIDATALLGALNAEPPAAADDAAQKVAERMNGHNAWSVDVVVDCNGVAYVTDMALACASYHWPECGFAGPEHWLDT